MSFMTETTEQNNKCPKLKLQYTYNLEFAEEATIELSCAPPSSTVC